MRLDAKHEENQDQKGPSIWALPPTLRQLADSGDIDLVEELLEDFQVDAASRLEAIGRALAAGDRASIQLEAHTIKGSALQVGANRLAVVASELEAAAKSAEIGRLAPLYDSLAGSFAEVRDLLAKRHRSSTPPADGAPHGE